MAYDGKLLRTALARFEEAKTRRAEELHRRERHIYSVLPRVAEIDRELGETVGKIIASAMRRGADPRPAIDCCCWA
ncbi:MAG: DNA replication protein DnaC, partial [Oscillospiraceae bacterium]|nr:DNA replication protein DnaC [Oscillospiraceae bacterium]